MERLRDKSLALQKERESLLQQAGLEKDALKPAYTCGKCQDTGFIDGKMCDCLKGLLRQEAYRRLNEMTPSDSLRVRAVRFAVLFGQRGRRPAFSPGTYGTGIGLLSAVCREIFPTFRKPVVSGAHRFGQDHLSLAIAREAIQKGYGVVYGSVQNFVTALEKERFGRDGGEGRQDTNQMLLHCDLLILDDLGTEFSTAFVTTALYNIINTRLMAEKPTVISTNLSMKELLDRYGERMVSRMIGGYQRILFAGRDVRQLKNMERERSREGF